MTELRKQLVRIVKDRGLRRLTEPVRLASGDMSCYFVDCKRALARGSHLKLAGDALCELAAANGVTFDAVGGLTMGADNLAHAVAMITDTEWFSVRKTQKDRGTRQRIEGAVLGPGVDVLLLDDVVTRGGSILEALEVIREAGATVVAAVTLVDRGVYGEKAFADKGIPYWPLVTFDDLEIPQVGSE